MAAIKFFVEDKTHIKFLIDFINERFNISFDAKDDFVKLGGWAGYKNALPKYQEFFANENIILTFLDADTDFSSRQKEVLTDFNSLNIQSQLFLFPNNLENGNIENALAEIAVDKKLIECFEKYETCIEGYQKPVSKSKIFAYLDALLETKNKKGDKKDLYKAENINYRNKQHWKLDHQYLNTLHTFLSPFLIPNS